MRHGKLFLAWENCSYWNAHDPIGGLIEANANSLEESLNIKFNKR